MYVAPTKGWMMENLANDCCYELLFVVAKISSSKLPIFIIFSPFLE